MVGWGGTYILPLCPQRGRCSGVYILNVPVAKHLSFIRKQHGPGDHGKIMGSLCLLGTSEVRVAGHRKEEKVVTTGFSAGSERLSPLA